MISQETKESMWTEAEIKFIIESCLSNIRHGLTHYTVSANRLAMALTELMEFRKMEASTHAKTVQPHSERLI